MAYTDFSNKTILHSWGRFRITLGAACVAGDLLARDGALADANANKPAHCIACQPGASGDVIWAAKKVETKKPDTISTGGVATQGDHSGTAGDVLWLSDTAGKASATPVANIAQVVGVVLSQDRAILEPSEQYDPRAELVAADKTLDIQDVGKQMIVTADAKVITLPAIASGLSFVVVNGMNDGACLVTISPAALDLIAGPDVAGVDNKDWLNTKATARCGDRLEFGYKDADGYIVTKVIGTWAQEA